ncbi:tetratricopeptide repeat protein [Streptomyces sp. JV178]|uniref:ATP-binding protein n=1 Tax=Streptomyces sp. JV178 TaxID=858632 RepID=UPI000C1B4877|nr:tetratricopeptide repeat protein [Streptomyces sp. JV178]
MAPRPGGETDKFGSRYEGIWTIRHALYVLLGQGDSLTLEPAGTLGEGTEFAYCHGDRTAVHQVKRQNRNANSWNVASLEAKGIWRHLRTHAEAGHDFHFVSLVPARALQELGDRARRSDDAPTFVRDWLTDELRVPFGELAAPGIYGSPETAWRMLRALWVEWHDERDMVAVNAALAEQVLTGAPGRLAALALGDLLLNSLGTRLDAAAMTARLPRYGLQRVTPSEGATVAPSAGGETQAAVHNARRTAPVLSGLSAPSSTFAGREAAVTGLLSALDPEAIGEGPSVHVVAGLPGVGKTELVRQVAHRAYGRDGWFARVLAVELYGYDPARRQSPDAALASLLRGLGIDHDHIPVGIEDRERMYRSALRSQADQGQRTLIILDDIMDAEQARPLLPDDPRIPVLITSRHTLSDLDARLHDLTVLDSVDSIDLLRIVLRASRGKGDTRVDDAPDMAEAIARQCGNLPLALRIVAALLADQPTRPLSSMAQALGDEHRRLRRLSRGNLAVRVAFELSYQHLPADQARLFQLFALNPGPNVSTESAAHLCAVDSDAAEELLEALGRGHLVQTTATYGRWRMHDLIRLYAVETGRADQTDDDRSAALDRLLRHYADCLAEARSHLMPGLAPAPRFGDRSVALSWLDEERANLVAAITKTPLRKRDIYVTVEMAGCIGDYLKLRRGFAELAAVYDRALEHCTEEAPVEFRAVFFDARGCALRGLSRFSEAVAAHEEALRIYRAAGHLLGEAETLTNLGHTLHEMGDFDQAVLVLQRAVVLQGKEKNHRGEGAALTNLGRSLDELGRHEEAVGVFRRDIEICRLIGDWHGEAVTQNCLGLALRALERAGEAATAHAAARDAFRRADDRHGVVMALTNLSTALRVGGLGDGIDILDEAIALCRDLGDKRAEGNVLTNLGVSKLQDGFPGEAAQTLMRAIELFEEVDASHGKAKALMNLSLAYSALKRSDRVAEALREAIPLLKAAGDIHLEGHARFLLASTLRATDLEEAISLSAVAVELLGQTHDELLTKRATALLAAMQESVDGA